MEANEKGRRIHLFREAVGEYVTKETTTWIKASGYFEVPASRTNHGNKEGGLFDHSYQVAVELANLTRKNNLRWEDERSPWIIGLFHDLCKLDQYVYVKDKDDYQYNQNQMLTGHGDKSCILTLRLMNLTDEEIMCIRYHMGPYEGKEAWESYNRAIKKFPNVLWTHTADMITSQIKGI